MTLHDFVKPNMSKEAEAVMMKAFEEAAKRQNELLEKAKSLE